jgi:hypothetical protein
MGYGAVRPNDAGRAITIRKGEEIGNSPRRDRLRLFRRTRVVERLVPADRHARRTGGRHVQRRRIGCRPVLRHRNCARRLPAAAERRRAFFDLLSRDATLFAIGDDERRTVDLRLCHWPE